MYFFLLLSGTKGTVPTLLKCFPTAGNFLAANYSTLGQKCSLALKTIVKTVSVF
jgi:hypothetical protein